MNVNVYLPDDLGQRAKDADLPFSQLLREAVRDELRRRETVSETLEQVETYEIGLEDRDGYGYMGRITGKSIAYSETFGVQVFLTNDERVIVYDERHLRHYELSDPVEDLRGWIGNDAAQYFSAVEALGEKPVIDL